MRYQLASDGLKEVRALVVVWDGQGRLYAVDPAPDTPQQRIWVRQPGAACRWQSPGEEA